MPLAVVIQGFFVGMFANLIPLPGGVGGVDAGMIGAFALFDLGLGSATLFAAVLTYRLIAFWLPLVPGSSPSSSSARRCGAGSASARGRCRLRDRRIAAGRYHYFRK